MAHGFRPRSALVIVFYVKFGLAEMSTQMLQEKSGNMQMSQRYEPEGKEGVEDDNQAAAADEVESIRNNT